MDKHILMVAYHFPPIQGSSGLLRTLAFANHLQDHNWKPIVLAPHPRAYPSTSEGLNEGIPEGVIVTRTCALDSARHLAIAGRYLRLTALPDRWITWWPWAVIAGLRLIRRYRPKVIWSTYPITTSHLIGYTLHRLTGIPWVADFRDPMVYENWPPEGMVRRLNTRIERAVITACNQVVVTTPSTLAFYKKRYPDLPADHWAVVPNGYDETAFESLAVSNHTESRDDSTPIVLVHSGLMELEDRDPTPLFEAISILKSEGHLSAKDLKIRLRATCRDEYYKVIIERLGLDGIIELAPHLPYQQALQEMLDADGLLLFQGPTCNRQIPAKLYEYFRTGKPIFALTDDSGDTAKTLREVGIEPVTPYHSSVIIKDRLTAFLQSLRKGDTHGVALKLAQRYSRKAGAMQLAKVLTRLTKP